MVDKEDIIKAILTLSGEENIKEAEKYFSKIRASGERLPRTNDLMFEVHRGQLAVLFKLLGYCKEDFKEEVGNEK